MNHATCGDAVEVRQGSGPPFFFDVEVLSSTVDLSAVLSAELWLKPFSCGCVSDDAPMIWTATVVEASPGYVRLRHVFDLTETAERGEWSVVPRLTFPAGVPYLGTAFALRVVDPWAT